MELEGKISVVTPARSGVSQSSGNSWMSQEYVMAYYWFPNQTNPSYIVLGLFGEEKIKKYNLQPNDEVKIRFHAEAHEYNGRWFNELRIDSVKFIGASVSKNAQMEEKKTAPSTEIRDAAQAAQAAQAEQQAGNIPNQDNQEGGKDDDLPF